MKHLFSWLSSLLLACSFLTAQQPSDPAVVYGSLFKDVQMQRVFPDGKTFVDCIPKRNPADIVNDYANLKGTTVDLKKFVEENFIIPSPPSAAYHTDTTEDVVTHIKRLWQVLRRNRDTAISGSSLLPLPYAYIVPGGRFREIYYWDSYFTQLGLQESGEIATMENMTKNFAYLINQFGFIPNGNRSYYLSRSQPPYFSLMVELLAGIQGNQVYAIYLPTLEKEYDFWMDKTANTKHVVKMPDGSILNRYYDQSDQPRQEAYREDVEVAKSSKRNQSQVLRNLRSCAETGWDFSSRWFSDGKNLTTIQVTDIVPVDLNCLLYNLEVVLARAQKESGDLIKQRYFEQLAERRKKAINKYCWSPSKQWYLDVYMNGKPTNEITIAGTTPLFCMVAPESNVPAIAERIEKEFLQPGGLTTTLKNTGQQWDAPNGWAPLQWIAIKGLENYHQDSLAKRAAWRWIKLNTDVYKRTGRLMEKYNVMNTTLEGGGGEYPSQDGFGWTNGVLLKLIAMYGTPPKEE
jgi:alpha,alpha-trehalase